MRSFVVFVALIVAASALPTREFIPVLDSDMDYSAWTLPALSAAIQDPNTPPAILPYLTTALNQMMADMWAGNPTEFIPVLDSDMNYSAWTLPALSAAIQDPNTPPAILPYLTTALNQMMADMWAGNPTEIIIVSTPVGLLDDVVPGPVSVVEQPIAVETPVAPVVTPIVTPVAPVAEAVAQASAPLVQLIVNINQAASIAPVAPVSPIAVNPIVPVSPVVVAPAPVINPVDVIAVNPIAPAPVEVNPVDVIAVMPVMPNPVDVIAISPPQINPIDVIAISAPEVNPVDIANPLPIVPVGAVGVVGPLL